MEKVLVKQYKSAIYDVGYSEPEQSIVWDFYVTHSFATTATQK